MPYGYPRTPRNSNRALTRARHGNSVSRTGSRVNRLVRAVSTAVRGVSSLGQMTRAARQMQMARRRRAKRNVSRTSGRGQDVTLTSDHTGLATKDLGMVKLGPYRAKIGKLLGNYKYQNRNQWIIQGLEGQQVADYTEICFSRQQLIGPGNSDRNNRVAWPVTPFQLNPYVTRGNTSVFPGPHQEVSRSDALYIKNVQCHLNMLSLVNVPSEAMVYWMMPVYDTDVDPISSWVTILESKNEGGIVQAPAADILQVNAVGGNARNTDFGANPFHHKEFRKVWKAVKSSKVLLQAGEQVNLRVRFHYEKILSRSTLAEVRKLQYLAGLTIFPVIIVRSGLIGLSPPGSGTAVQSAEVSNAASKVGVVSNWQCEFGALGAARLSTSQGYSGVVEVSNMDKQILDDNDEVVNLKYV